MTPGTSLWVPSTGLPTPGCGHSVSPTTPPPAIRTPERRIHPWTQQIRIGTGFQYDWSKDVTVGVAYEYAHLGGRKDGPGGAGPSRVPSRVNTTPFAIHFFAVNVIWKVLIYNWIHKRHPQFSNFENPAKLISQKKSVLINIYILLENNTRCLRPSSL